MAYTPGIVPGVYAMYICLYGYIKLATGEIFAIIPIFKLWIIG